MINDVFINTQEIKDELDNMQQMAEIFRTKFSLLSQNINYIFSKIKDCKTIQDANKYFELLEKIQGTLARLLYEYKIGMPDRLIRFVQDFDNFEEVKEYYFKKIILGEYAF